MKSSWMRSLAAPVLAACAAAVTSGSAPLVSVLTLGLHKGDHVHSVRLVAEEGHLHLILSHDEGADRDPQGAGHHGVPATSTSESDHVFHLTSDDAANTSLRRAGFTPAPAAAAVVAVLPAPTLRCLLHPSREPLARSSDSPRSIVLRL